MLALEIIAQRRIDESAARGDLQGLPGEGAPLDLYEDPLVPPEMKMVKKILGNADISVAEVFGALRERQREILPQAGQLLTNERPEAAAG